jgi:ribose transport system ATP-binding protein
MLRRAASRVGNQQKVVLAKWLMSEPSIFIMDEPTRGIDVGAKYEIYMIIDRLAASGAGVIFISSELDELLAIADRILVMSQGEIVTEFPRSHFDRAKILAAAFREREIAA